MIYTSSLPSLEPTDAIEPHRSTRARNPPTYLRDFHCNLLTNAFVVTDVPYSLGKYLSYDKCSSTQKHHLLNISSDYEPTFYHQVAPFPHGRKTMEEELATMERTNTWTVVSLPKDHQV